MSTENVRVMKQHLATGELVGEYSNEIKRDILQKNANPNSQIRTEFNAKNKVLTNQIQKEDKAQLGDVWNVPDEELKEMIRVHKQTLARKNADQSDRTQALGTLNKMKQKYGLYTQAGQEKAKEAGDLNRDSLQL